jgi:hypothetical protein
MIYAEYPVWRTETTMQRCLSSLWQKHRRKGHLGIFGVWMVCWGWPDREDGQDHPVSKPEGEDVMGWCEWC